MNLRSLCPFCVAVAVACGIVLRVAAAAGARPLAVGILVDVHPRQRAVIDFERRVLERLPRVVDDIPTEAVVVGYSDRVQPPTPWASMTSTLAAAAEQLTVDERAAVGRTALNDGLMNVMTALGARAPERRRVLIVVGEGNDAGSPTPFGDVLSRAKADRIESYALFVATHRSEVGRVRQFGFDLRRLSSGTDGKIYDLRTDPSLLERSLDDLTRRLGATSDSQNGKRSDHS